MTVLSLVDILAALDENANLRGQVERALGLREEWRIEWDGEPKMGGGAHVASVSTTWPTLSGAQRAASLALATKSNVRFAHRLATAWEH